MVRTAEERKLRVPPRYRYFRGSRFPFQAQVAIHFDERRPTRRYAAGRLRADRRQLRPNRRPDFDVQENAGCDLGQASGRLGKQRDRSITPHAGRLTTFCRRQSRWHGLARLGEEFRPSLFSHFWQTPPMGELNSLLHRQTRPPPAFCLTNSRRCCSLLLCLICGHIVIAGRPKSTGREGWQDYADWPGEPGNTRNEKQWERS